MLAKPSALTEVLAWLQAFAPTAHLCSDSRAIARGDIFFAYPGDSGDGRQYIAAAHEQAAGAVVYEADGFDWNQDWTLPHLAVSNLKQIAGPIASAYYGQPDAALFSVAVTGTNGKTSCSQWLGQALSGLGQPTAVIGTLGAGLFKEGRHDGFEVTGYTTPDALLLQRTLSDLRADGAQALAIEASSIGLDQHRLDGLHFDAALFTNFTRDHLDYHGDMAAYEKAKTILFDWPGLQYAIVNLDDAMGMRLVQRLKQKSAAIRIIGYGIAYRQAPDIEILCASAIRSIHGGTQFQLDSSFGTAQVKTQLVGQFNVSNVLGILAVLLAKGATLEAALDQVEKLVAVPGRMQQLGGQDAPLVVIDYAHTPDALEKTLATLRPIAQQRDGQLWCVFGCGGDRDPGKRAPMGLTALAADHVVVTSDNPRNEDPAGIIAQIMTGIDAAGKAALAPQVIEDRATAILRAVKHANKNDVILLAGKGHETYQEIKGRKLPFSDADHAALALAAYAMMGVAGNGMHG